MGRKNTSTVWAEHRQVRRQRRAGLEPQPRNERGFIVKRIEDHDVLVFCCKRCLNESLTVNMVKREGEAKAAARAATKAGRERKRQKATAKAAAKVHAAAQ